MDVRTEVLVFPGFRGPDRSFCPRTSSEDFSLLVAFLLVTFSCFFRGFFVALFCLEKQCSGLFRYFFVVFSWLFRGPRFG